MEHLAFLRIVEGGKAEPDCSTSAIGIVRKDGATVLFRDPLDDREPEAGPPPAAREERLEDPVQIARVEPGAGIGYLAFDPAVAAEQAVRRPDRDPPLRGGVLESVGEKVLEHLSES
jgi:hypothetical protein